MSEDKNININLSLGSGVVDKTIENLIDKPSKSIGETFNDIWYLSIGGPLGHWAEKRKIKYGKDLERFKEEIKTEIEQIPDEKYIEADIQFVGQVLEASKYCAEKIELRKMFAKMIGASMNMDKKEYVHPMFIDAVSKMTDKDAKILYLLSKRISPKIDLKVTVDELAFSLVVLMELGIIIEAKNYDKKNYKFDKMGALYYLILKKYEECVIGDENCNNVVSIKDYRIDDIDFIHGFLWEEFRMTRFGQSLINTCIL